MLPVIALVGRPNVGKSTLFNRLTKSRDALVADIPGLTRDRQYGTGSINEYRFIVIDTGGIGEEAESLDNLVTQQSLAAIEEAHIVFFLLDGRAELSTGDETIAAQLRTLEKPVYLCINKAEGLDEDMVKSNFYQLGMQNMAVISASHGDGITHLMETVLQPYADELETDQDESGIKVAVIGRPNVGKSTLINAILGEDRLLAFDQPGTTRDSIFIPCQLDGDDYVFIDTAGVRRRARLKDKIEKFSVVKTLQAIDEANVVVFMLDGLQDISDQDAHLLGLVVDSGRSLVLAINKTEDLGRLEQQAIKDRLDYKLPFVQFASICFISAAKKFGLKPLLKEINKAYKSSQIELTTPEVNQLLELALSKHQLPLVRGRRIKLRYAHQGGQNPPTIVIHGNQTQSVPDSYKRYLMKFFQSKLKLSGTPVRLIFKTGDNPYAGKRNTLTPRQERKRKRLLKHVKKK